MFRRRRFGRRRFRRNKFLWTATGELILQPQGGGISEWITERIFPSGRSSWLCDTGRIKQFRVRRIDAWLELVFNNVQDGSGDLPSAVLPYIVRTRAGSDNSADENFNPFDQPEVPSAISSWQTDTESDAGAPLVWRTYIRPRYMWNTLDATITTTSLNGYNNYEQLSNTPSANRVFQAMGSNSVWHPNLRLRTRLPMTRADELAFGCQVIDSGSSPVNQAQMIMFFAFTFWGA